MRKSIWVFSSLVLFAAGAGFFLKSSFFKIVSVTVSANSIDIKQALESEGEHIQGQNLWELDLDAFSSRLLDKYKTIKTITFQRHWPSVLFLKAEERKGVAMVFADKELWTIDREGIPFAKIKGSGLPLFWPVAPDHKTFLIILSWLEGAQPKIVNGLAWDTELGVVVYTDNKAKLILGRENFFENWRKAREALEFLRTRGIQAKRIDASYNKRAVVSL